MTNGADREVRFEALVVRAAAGDEASWQALWVEIAPSIERLVAHRRFLGPLGKDTDDRRNIVVEVMARLRARRFHRLRLYVEARARYPEGSFFTWLRAVIKRVAIDYMRAHTHYVDQRRSALPGDAPGRWIALTTLPPPSQLPSARPRIQTRCTAAELLRHAAASLPALLARALGLWIQGYRHDEIARALALIDAAHAQRLVRAALERLRRRFRP